MDPITHTLCGVALGNAFFRKRGGRAAWPILALASNLPDLDAVVHLTGDPAAVLMRRTFGHSLLLLPYWCAALAWMLGRRYRRLRFPTLFGMVLLGAVVHVFLDLINSFGVVLFWPLSRVRPELAMVFIVDLALTVILALPLLLCAFRRLRRRLVPWSRAGLAAAAAYLVLCAGSRAAAADILEQQVSHGRGAATPDFIYVFPEPLGPLRWRGVVRVGDIYRIYLVRPLSGTALLRDQVRTEIDDPHVVAARRTRFGRRLDWFFKAPVWRVADRDAPRTDQGIRVNAYDLRFQPLLLNRPPVFEFSIDVPVLPGAAVGRRAGAPARGGGAGAWRLTRIALDRPESLP